MSRKGMVSYFSAVEAILSSGIQISFPVLLHIISSPWVFRVWLSNGLDLDLSLFLTVTKLGRDMKGAIMNSLFHN